MAFAAVVSLKMIIEKYLFDRCIRLDRLSRKILKFAYKEVESAEEIAKRVLGFNGRRVVAEMEGAVNKLREALESHIDDDDSQSEGIANLETEINFFTETMKMLEKEYPDDIYNSFPQGEDYDDDDDDDVASPRDKSLKMVGLSDQYNHLKEMLTIDRTTELQVVSLFGMPGIGKTTLARKIFQDSDSSQHFECRVWVKVGRKCVSKDIPRRILAELKPDNDQMCVEDDAAVARCLNKSLKGKRYLIVLDDVWDKYMAEFLQTCVYLRRGKKSVNRFPDELNGSRILLTSRLQQRDGRFNPSGATIDMRLMDEEESWLLLHELVFIKNEEACPFELEVFGRKIAERCEGLPLTIVAVAKLLSKQDRTAEWWSEVATKKNCPLFKAVYNEISKVLFPSYIHLPRPLQMCFMFIGIFPQYYEIPWSKLVNLCECDGFLEQDHGLIECFKELASNSMVMIVDNISTATWDDIGEDIKSCRLHTSLWHLSNREAKKSKFSCVLNSVDDVYGDGTGIERQQRLSFHENVLFAIKGVNESVEDTCASTAHCLLCYGPYLQYPVPICFGLKLLREFDALAIRFYEFPTEVLDLVELRYLALTLNGNIPATIVQLSNLRFLIVDRHVSMIKSIEQVSYLPSEIWNMKELKHVQVSGKDLPSPCGASMESLLTLSRVSPSSCSEELFWGVPNLRKLGIQIELSPDKDGEQLIFVGRLLRPMMLKSVKCVLMNPRVGPAMSLPSMFPLCLTKLTLSGLCNPWEEMSMIPELQFLRVLKLQNYAFRGPEWEVEERKFFRLRSLIVEDTDLVRWKIGEASLYCLEYLSIKHCYKLKGISIPGGFGRCLQHIEIVDCNPMGVELLKEATSAKVNVSCSWIDKKPKA